MSRWSVRLRREAGNTSLQSVLVIGAAALLVVALVGWWSGTIRPALRGAAVAHLLPTDAGAASPPGAGLPPAPVPEADESEPEEQPVDEDELPRKERRFARARGENEPRQADGEHTPPLTERLKELGEAGRAERVRDGQKAARDGGPTRLP